MWKVSTKRLIISIVIVTPGSTNILKYNINLNYQAHKLETLLQTFPSYYLLKMFS